jgi:hypothetical protein
VPLMRDPGEPDFALGTLGARVRGLRCRMLVLPGDPNETSDRFDDAFWKSWQTQTPRSQKGTTPFGNDFRASAWGAVWYQTSGDELWDSFLSLSQSGVLDVGIGRPAVTARSDLTAFRLLAIVGRLWTALSYYQLMIEQRRITGPFEISLGMRDTQDTVIAHLAAGWMDMDDLRWGPVVSKDSSYLGRWEREEISNAEHTRDLVFEVGDWIDQCWGSWQRRFVNATSDGTGAFDWGRFT